MTQPDMKVTDQDLEQYDQMGQWELNQDQVIETWEDMPELPEEKDNLNESALTPIGAAWADPPTENDMLSAEADFFAVATAQDGAQEKFPLLTGTPLEVGLRAALDVYHGRLIPGRLCHSEDQDYTMHQVENAAQRLYMGFTLGSYWAYSDQDGHWLKIPIEAIHRAIVCYNAHPYGEIKAGGKRTPLSISQAMTSSAESTLRNFLYRPGVKWFDDVDRAPGLPMRSRYWSVHLAAGRFSVATSTPANPFHYQRFAYPFDWHPSAGEALNQLKYLSPVAEEWLPYCPAFLTFLRSCLPAQELDARTIQEFFGASLYGIAPRFQTALLLIGSGGNGKGTLMKIMKGIFPQDTVSHANPGGWRNDYERTSIIGKILNICLETSAFLSPDAIKSVVCGDEMEGRYTGANSSAPFPFRPSAGCCFSANRLPRVAFDKAIGGRFRILEFRQNFRNMPNQIPEDEIIRKCRTEAPGILLWLTAGLLRLIENGRITESPDSVAAVKRWEAESDVTSRYINDWLLIGPDHTAPGDKVLTRVLYTHFRQYCENEGVPTFKIPTKPDFTAILIERGGKDRSFEGKRYIGYCKVRTGDAKIDLRPGQKSANMPG